MCQFFVLSVFAQINKKFSYANFFYILFGLTEILDWQGPLYLNQIKFALETTRKT
jgi:hypothetical protein